MNRDNMPPLLYESELDRINQQKAIEYLMTKWNFTAYDCPPNYPLDYLCKRDKDTVAFVEVRVRTNRMNKYPTMICSLKKYKFAKEVGELFNIPILFLVHWTGCGTTAFIDMVSNEPKLDIQLVDYRNDVRDLEPIVHWSIDRFTILHKAIQH